MSDTPEVLWRDDGSILVTLNGRSCIVSSGHLINDKIAQLKRPFTLPGARASPPASLANSPSTASPSMAEQLATTSTEIVDPNSTRAIYEEALAESLVTNRDAAKMVILDHVRRVESARLVLQAAETKLAEVLNKTPAEIAMMRKFY
jgi:hypothetical protein